MLFNSTKMYGTAVKFVVSYRYEPYLWYFGNLAACFYELILVGWIRIQEGKNDQKKVNKFHVLKCWMFSF
jgi:hypothetical protein